MTKAMPHYVSSSMVAGIVVINLILLLLPIEYTELVVVKWVVVAVQ